MALIRFRCGFRRPFETLTRGRVAEEKNDLASNDREQPLAATELFETRRHGGAEKKMSTKAPVTSHVTISFETPSPISFSHLYSPCTRELRGQQVQDTLTSCITRTPESLHPSTGTCRRVGVASLDREKVIGGDKFARARSACGGTSPSVAVESCGDFHGARQGPGQSPASGRADPGISMNFASLRSKIRHAGDA
jgi:hypothetical protein